MSLICMLVVALVTMAMVVVLSAFNGIEDLIDQRYSLFDADISILPLANKVIFSDALDCESLASHTGIASCQKVIQERVFAQYDGNQRIVILKGVDSAFVKNTGLDTMMVDGEATLSIKNSPTALIGIGVKYDLDLRLFEQIFNPLKLSALIRGRNLRRNMEKALNNKGIPVAGIFSINIDFDRDFVLVPFAWAADLLRYKKEYSALELRLLPGTDLEKIKSEIATQLGDSYQVRSRYEKNSVIYKTNKTEKWATFVIMGFIMLIATFNIIAALTLLINEKKGDVKTLKSMGATQAMIKKVFFIEGALINLVGAAFGVILGLVFVFLQQHFGLVRLEGGLVEYYPVEIELSDLLFIFSLVLVCGLLSSIVPVQIFTKRFTD